MAATAGAVALGLMVLGCGQNDEPVSAAAGETMPPCEGVATSDYGLGDAIRASLSALTSLSPRFSTGTGTAVPAAGTNTLLVEVHLCGPGAQLDTTKDAATAVAREVAISRTLGDRVQRMTVLNPSTGQRIAAEPFEASAFASDAAASTLRSRWHPTAR
ncbi:hypothetical protein [Gordonia hirsuta]|uniref:hypothetical protein n=1 Tax=Gordonia hirsuta TaxID=53427 RepID=UPI00034C3048|nr:hypothetical protein [Gordonia hirsuta]